MLVCFLAQNMLNFHLPALGVLQGAGLWSVHKVSQERTFSGDLFPKKGKSHVAGGGKSGLAN